MAPRQPLIAVGTAVIATHFRQTDTGDRPTPLQQPEQSGDDKCQTHWRPSDSWNERAHPFAWTKSADDDIIAHAKPSTHHKKT